MLTQTLRRPARPRQRDTNSAVKVLRQLTTIVAPDTLLKWIRAEKKSGNKQPAKLGRRRTPEAIRLLILKFAKENEWDYTRILGELKKLGIRSISRNTVKRVLKDAGLDTGPQRGEGTWDEFLKQHAASLWQCDFFSKRIATLKGIREVFVLALLNVKTRRVILSPATFHPNEAWVVARAESFVSKARGSGLPITYVQRDRDRKFTKSLDAKLKSLRVKMKPGAFRAPNTNAFVERFIQSIQQECLDRFVIFGEQHIDQFRQEYPSYYHEERPHQSLDNPLLATPKNRGRPKSNRWHVENETVLPAKLRRRQRLSGLLKSYYRQSA